MTKRKGSHCHYEVALENFLREKKILYLAINEAKRPLFKKHKVKNFDFVIVTKSKKFLLCDVKGKSFPYDYKNSKNYWENWVTRDDLKYLELWSKTLGHKGKGIFLFIYWVKYKADQKLFRDVYNYKGRFYALVGIDWNTYKKHMKARSKTGEGRYNAISISRQKFCNLIKPLSIMRFQFLDKNFVI